MHTQVLRPGTQSIAKLMIFLFICIFSAILTPSALADNFFIDALKTPGESSPEPPTEVLVNFYLEHPLEVNEPYVRDTRTLNIDSFVPKMTYTNLYRYRNTDNVITWIMPIPYSSSVDVYLNFPKESGVTTAWMNDTELKTDIPVTVKATELAEIKICNSTNRGIVRFVFSTMPMISITYDEKPEKDSDTPAHIIIADPEFREHGYETGYFESDAVISKRGQSSARFYEKYPLNISFMKDGEKYDHSVLGMREDSDWILDSAYADASRVRNRVLLDLWSEIYRLPWSESKSGAPEGVFTEVYINNRYHGIYAFSEKQDRKQVGLKKVSKGGTGTMFKTRATNSDKESPAGFVSMGSEMPGDVSNTTWLNVEMKYPKADDATLDMWKDFYDMTKLVVDGSDEEFVQNIQKYVDLDNLSKYFLFINIFDVTDNMRKNMTFVRHDEGDPYQLVPWDLDASLGRYYSSKKSRTYDYSSNALFDRLLNLNVDGFYEKTIKTWNEYKDTHFSTDNLMKHIRSYTNRFISCNAHDREYSLYPEFEHYLGDNYRYIFKIPREVEYIEEYTNEHRAFFEDELMKLSK